MTVRSHGVRGRSSPVQSNAGSITTHFGIAPALSRGSAERSTGWPGGPSGWLARAEFQCTDPLSARA